MADYNVEFSHSTLDRPWVFDVHVVMQPILGVPAGLSPAALRVYIEVELMRSIEGIAHIEGPKIREA